MGCTWDLIKTAGWGGVGIYMGYKAFDWDNPFWKLFAGSLAAVGGLQTFRKGSDANDSCDFHIEEKIKDLGKKIKSKVKE